MKTDRIPRQVLAFLTLLGVLLGILVGPAWAADAPTITAFSPTSGPVGTLVTINGTNFIDVTGVKFKNTAAAFDVKSSTLLTATVPAGAMTGKIIVTTPDGTGASATEFTVTASTAAPTISSFSPTSGPVGTSVIVNGTNFTGAISVKFNGVSATFNVNAGGTRITAKVPSGATTGKITVTTPGGTATSATDFIVTASAAPTISSFSPSSGPVGTAVTINGSNFSGATTVTFNGISATFNVNSAGTKITTKVPSGATTGKITVITPGRTATSAKDFVVTGAIPTITSFTPTSGKAGTVVTITGTSFTGATSVKFGGVSASFTVNSSTKITATVSAGAKTGPISVTTPAGTGTSASTFTVVLTFHSRSISLFLRRHLVATGAVRVSDGFAACYQGVGVRIQRRVSGRWRTIATTLTNDLGRFRASIANRAGRYRAVAPRDNEGSDVCRRAVSQVVTRG
jgi:hypothetical protein